MQFPQIKSLFALALGMFFLSACGEKGPEPEPQPEPEPVVVYEDEPEQTLRDQKIASVVMKDTMRYCVWLPEGFNRGKK